MARAHAVFDMPRKPLTRDFRSCQETAGVTAVASRLLLWKHCPTYILNNTYFSEYERAGKCPILGTTLGGCVVYRFYELTKISAVYQ